MIYAKCCFIRDTNASAALDCVRPGCQTMPNWRCMTKSMSNCFKSWLIMVFGSTDQPKPMDANMRMDSSGLLLMVILGLIPCFSNSANVI